MHVGLRIIRSQASAPAASSARRAAPGQPFAATELRLPIGASCVRNWPIRSHPPAAISRLSACTDLDVASHGRWLEIAQIRVCYRSRQASFPPITCSDQMKSKTIR
jgi:hypothetical protein